jgi:hypothetical protein
MQEPWTIYRDTHSDNFTRAERRWESVKGALCRGFDGSVAGPPYVIGDSNDATPIQEIDHEDDE